MEAPESRRGVAQTFTAMVHRVLGPPSADYLAVVPPRLRDATAALIVLTDPHGHGGAALLQQARTAGWAAHVQQHGELLADKRRGYGLGPLDGLLYRGHITGSEYWTASTLFALWRDSRAPSLTAAGSLRGHRVPVAFSGGYTAWDNVQTLDLSRPEDCALALTRGYILSQAKRAEHLQSLGKAAAQWKHTPERFAYRVPVQLQGTYPWFGLVPFLTHLTPWHAGTGQNLCVPVFSLSVFQHDLDFLHNQPLTAVPRLGVDSVRTLQDQVLENSRAVGISHGFPWSDRHRHQYADFAPTGEAGFAWHDVGHLCVGSVDPPQARTTLVRLHRELTAHAKSLDLPESVGRFPFRKPFVARLFSLTDQSRTSPGLSATEALQIHTQEIVGETLTDLLLSANAARVANVRSNFTAQLPPNRGFYAKSFTGTKAGLPSGVVWEKDAAVARLAKTWQRFANTQVAYSRSWLHAQGYSVDLTESEEIPLNALVVLPRGESSIPDEAYFQGASIAVSLETQRWSSNPFYSQVFLGHRFDDPKA